MKTHCVCNKQNLNTQDSKRAKKREPVEFWDFDRNSCTCGTSANWPSINKSS